MKRLLIPLLTLALALTISMTPAPRAHAQVTEGVLTRMRSQLAAELILESKLCQAALLSSADAKRLARRLLDASRYVGNQDQLDRLAEALRSRLDAAEARLLARFLLMAYYRHDISDQFPLDETAMRRWAQTTFSSADLETLLAEAEAPLPYLQLLRDELGMGKWSCQARCTSDRRLGYGMADVSSHVFSGSGSTREAAMAQAQAACESWVATLPGRASGPYEFDQVECSKN